MSTIFFSSTKAVTLLHCISEPVFEGIDGLPADLIGKNVYNFETSSLRFEKLTRNRFCFDRDLLSSFCSIHFVLVSCHYSIVICYYTHVNAGYWNTGYCSNINKMVTVP